MKSLLLISALFATITLSLAAAEPPAPRTVILKTDDMRDWNANWDRVIQISKEKNIPVSIGIITSSLDKNSPETLTHLKTLSDSGLVEFWNHGWDHRRWKEGDKTISEFSASGLAHQQDHLARAQAAATAAGLTFHSFGAPFNAIDQDTVTALNAIPDLTSVFVYNNPLNKAFQGKTLLLMPLKGEADGTGKPNFEKFRADYEANKNNLTFIALQFHPPQFDDHRFAEYIAIIDFLKQEGWTFTLPTPYAATHPSTAPRRSSPNAALR